MSSTVACHGGRGRWACRSDDPAPRGTVATGDVAGVPVTCRDLGGERWACRRGAQP